MVVDRLSEQAKGVPWLLDQLFKIEREISAKRSSPEEAENSRPGCIEVGEFAALSCQTSLKGAYVRSVPEESSARETHLVALFVLVFPRPRTTAEFEDE